MQFEMAHTDDYSCASGTLVIFTRAEALLRERAPAGQSTRDAVTELSSTRVPLVLVSDSESGDVRTIQRELGLVQPLISNAGVSFTVRQAISLSRTMSRLATNGKCSAGHDNGTCRSQSRATS